MRRIPIYTQGGAGTVEVPDLTRRERRAHYRRWLNSRIDRACNWKLALAVLALAILAPVIALKWYS